MMFVNQRVLVSVLAVLAIGTASRGTSAPAGELPDSVSPKVMTQAPEIGKYGGAYVVAQFSDPSTFNPALEPLPSETLAPVFESLVEQNYLTGEIEPALAETWTTSDHGRTWMFTLRQGVHWHDGTPLTMDDVLFSLEAVFVDGVQASARDRLTIDNKPIRWRKVDDRRIVFRADRPVGVFLQIISALPIIPKHRLADALRRGAAEFNRSWDPATPAREIVGTGPFTVQQYVPGQQIAYLRNPNYWKVDVKGNRLPYLTRYIRLIVPTQDAMRLKFLANETDIYRARPREFAELKQGERAGNYAVYDGPETFATGEFLVLNQNPGGVAPPKLAWFQDVRFRRALNAAIDRTTIAQQIYAGRATPAWGPVSIGNKLYYNPNLPHDSYDLTRAQHLLADAGYSRGSDGVLRDSQGNVVAFVLTTTAGSADREAIGTIVRRDFSKLGMNVSFVPEAFTTLVGKLAGGVNWDAAVLGLTSSLEPQNDGNVWLSTGPLHLWRPKQEKPATEWEAEVDGLFERAAAELNQEKRKQLYDRWQEIVAQELPLMYLAYPKTQPAVRNTLGNVKIGLQGVIGDLATLYSKAAYRE